MTTLEVRAQDALVGRLEHDPATQRWTFAYDADWLARDDRFALSPALPLIVAGAQTAEQHSNAVRIFFENLLPEGRTLDDAAAANRLSKTNTFGLLRALGKETAGALEIFSAENAAGQTGRARHISRTDLSERIRARPHQPFTVWDGRVRLSIAGYQDKLGVLEESDEWYLVDGPGVASTHLLKPEPPGKPLTGMTTNERLCMALAGAVGIPVAGTRLVHVPEPVLVIERFDRVRTAQGVTRLHCIDGCQALGLPVNLKCERPYGDGRDVRDIRDGATLPLLFDLLDKHTPTPTAERLTLLRWTILQTLIGNTDAHAKNLSFFVSPAGLRLAPAYDLVCVLVYEQSNVTDTLAMAIGDEFEPRKLRAFDWAVFAERCGLPARLVAREMTALADRCIEQLPGIAAQVRTEGGDAATIDGIVGIVEEQVKTVLSAAPDVPHMA